MEAKVRKALLSRSAPLPPMCEQYLDFSTLGSREDELTVVGHFTETYVNNPGPNVSTPATYARELVSSYDAVTINLMRSAFDAELIDFSVFVKIRNNYLTGVLARNYVLMMIAIRDLEARSGSFRQFIGIHDVRKNGTTDEFILELSTDEQYRGNVACLRYGVKVTNGLLMREGEALFYRRSGFDDLIVAPQIEKILWSHPDKADLIADIVIERKAQDPEVIMQVLDGTVAPPLSSGAL